MDPDKQIIEMKAERTEKGEIRYTSSGLRQKRGRYPGWLLVVLGAAVGVVFFLLLATLFVYVIVPILAVLFIWFLAKNLFRSLTR